MPDFDRRLRASLWLLALVGCIIAGALIHQNGRPECPAAVHTHHHHGREP